MSRPAACALAFALAAVPLGCGSPPPEPENPYKNIPSVSVFKDDAPANRAVPTGGLPTDLVDQDGKPVDLTKYRGQKNLVLVVTRGIPQSPGGVPCSYCVAQAISLSYVAQEFTNRDAVVLILFPGSTEKIGDFIQQAAPIRKQLPFPVLLDRDLVVCDRLGIRGDLAKPSTYIVDKAGNVVYAYVGETRTDRPSVKALLGQLDKLQGIAPAPKPPATVPTPAARPTGR